MTDVYVPGRHVLESESPLDPKRCKAQVTDGGAWSRTYQCTRKAGADGWCGQHHPDAAARRKAERDAKWEAQRKRDERIWRRPREYQEALCLIAAGHNDARQVARDALAKWDDLPKEADGD